MTTNTQATDISTAPLPQGYRSTFVETPRLRHHVVTGGSGPALLLINGWPQTWYAWRLILPRLAESFTVVAIEPRGMGLTDKPASGYDMRSMADDLAAVMTELGHATYGVLGHDVGMWIGYALAADHRHAVTRLAVTEAMIPGISPEPAFFAPNGANARLFHFGFNRLEGINAELVRGRERLFFGYQFESKTAASKHLTEDAVQHYVDSIAHDEHSLNASFGPYRALEETMAQNDQRRQTPLDIPVLAIGGAESTGEVVAATMAEVAGDVMSVVIDGCGHFPAEECPDEMLNAVLPFFEA